MKLPILGIIIVIFLQLGFTAYNALDRPMESLSLVKAVRVGNIPVAELPDDLVVNADFYDEVRPRFRYMIRDFTISSANVRNNRRPASQVVFSNTVIRIPAAKPLRLQTVAMEKPWESTVITYPKPIHSGRESENLAFAAERSSEKKSFVAKSVSVMKKPYGWIKALGSRINL